MLILTRKIGESLIILDGIRVQVLGLRGKQVRLGIEAPEDVVVLREEVFQRLARENREAAAFRGPDVEALGQEARRRLRPIAMPAGPPEEVPLVPVASAHLGLLRVGGHLIFTFRPRLPGFAQARRFALVEHPRVAPFLWLQSLEDPSLALVAAAPETLGGECRERLAGAMKGLSGDELVLVLVTVPPNRPREAAAHLNAPLVLDQETRRARQVALENIQHLPQLRVLPPEAPSP